MKNINTQTTRKTCHMNKEPPKLTNITLKTLPKSTMGTKTNHSHEETKTKDIDDTAYSQKHTQTQATACKIYNTPRKLSRVVV